MSVTTLKLVCFNLFFYNLYLCCSVTSVVDYFQLYFLFYPYPTHKETIEIGHLQLQRIAIQALQINVWFCGILLHFPCHSYVSCCWYIINSMLAFFLSCFHLSLSTFLFRFRGREETEMCMNITTGKINYKWSYNGFLAYMTDQYNLEKTHRLVWNNAFDILTIQETLHEPLHTTSTHGLFDYVCVFVIG